MSEITPAELAEWREAAEKATAGPWVVVEFEDSDGEIRRFVGFKWGHGEELGWLEDSSMPNEADAHFIALARTAMPRLITEVVALRATITSLADQLDELKPSNELSTALRAIAKGEVQDAK